MERYQGVDLKLIESEEKATDSIIDYGDGEEYAPKEPQPLLKKADKEKIQQLIKDFFSSTEDKNLKRKEINDLIEEKIHRYCFILFDYIYGFNQIYSYNDLWIY